MVTKETFLPNYIQVGLVVSDKKTFLYRHAGENKPRSLAAMSFLTNHGGLNNLVRGSPKEHICQIILKSVQRFLTRRFVVVVFFFFFFFFFFFCCFFFFLFFCFVLFVCFLLLFFFVRILQGFQIFEQLLVSIIQGSFLCNLV